MPFYERGDVRIHYEESGNGYPLLIIPGGGLNSDLTFMRNGPFNPMAEFSNEYRCISSDLRHANAGQSEGHAPRCATFFISPTSRDGGLPSWRAARRSPRT